MLTDLILGTAGHIDHGKTSLIAALTGTNTDRLPEEKKRGITIELGYAYLQLDPFRLGVVDVPGHEKFVRQMLAGATGMDLAMLVVAADDSVKQQTREHLDILRILDLPAGVIALSKCDLVDPDWLGLVEEEIRGVVAGTFLAQSPIVRTSVKTGMGMDDLREALRQQAEIAAQSNRQQRLLAPFRMAIDRSFAIEGHGTVVTGSISSGSTSVGNVLEIQPGNHQVRIRSLQNHEQVAEEVHRGQRAAINLAGIRHNEVQRGQELCQPGHLVASRLMTLDLFLLSTAKKPLKDRTRVRFHLGTAELLGIVRLLEGSELLPGERTHAQIYLNAPAVATWNQPFVIRFESPVFTIGGGRVLDPNAMRLRKLTELDLQMLQQLNDTDSIQRASASAFFHASTSWSPSELPRTAGVVETDTVLDQLKSQGQIVELKISATRNFLIQRQRFEQFCDRIVVTLDRMHRENPLRFNHPLTSLRDQFSYLGSPELLTGALQHLQKEKKIELTESTIGLVGYGPNLSKGEKQLLSQLVNEIKNAGLQPPTPKELYASAQKNRQAVLQLLQLASESGQIVKVSQDMYVHSDVMQDVCSRLKSEIVRNNGMTMSEIRQLLDTSRKYAVPLCEYLDSINFTRRSEDKRLLGTAATNEEIHH